MYSFIHSFMCTYKDSCQERTSHISPSLTSSTPSFLCTFHSSIIHSFIHSIRRSLSSSLVDVVGVKETFVLHVVFHDVVDEPLLQKLGQLVQVELLALLVHLGKMAHLIQQTPFIFWRLNQKKNKTKQNKTIVVIIMAPNAGASTHTRTHK